MMMTMKTESQICPPLPTLLFQCGLYALFTIYKPARQFNVQHLLAALNPPLTPPQSLHCLRSPNCQIIWENPLVRGRLDQSVILGFANHETLTFLWIFERTFLRCNCGQIWGVRLSEMGSEAFQWTFSSDLVNPDTNSSKLGANTLGPLALLADADVRLQCNGQFKKKSKRRF